MATQVLQYKTDSRFSAPGGASCRLAPLLPSVAPPQQHQLHHKESAAARSPSSTTAMRKGSADSGTQQLHFSSPSRGLAKQHGGYEAPAAPSPRLVPLVATLVVILISLQVLVVGHPPSFSFVSAAPAWIARRAMAAGMTPATPAASGTGGTSWLSEAGSAETAAALELSAAGAQQQQHHHRKLLVWMNPNGKKEAVEHLANKVAGMVGVTARPRAGIIAVGHATRLRMREQQRQQQQQKKKQQQEARQQQAAQQKQR